MEIPYIEDPNMSTRQYAVSKVRKILDTYSFIGNYFEKSSTSDKLYTIKRSGKLFKAIIECGLRICGEIYTKFEVLNEETPLTSDETALQIETIKTVSETCNALLLAQAQNNN